MSVVRVLLTRPLDEAERTADTLRRLGHEALIAPVLRIEPLPEARIGEGPFTAVLLTSGNAARAIAAHPRGGALTRLPVFAVGGKTAEAARTAGFSDVVSADGDAESLLALIAERIPASSRPLLYLAGSDIARDLGGALAARGLKVETVVLYRAVAAEALPEAAAAALRAGAVGAALHYSRRSAAIFVDCAAAAGLLPQVGALMHCCLSERASEPLRGIGAADIRIASAPGEAALIGLLPRA